MGSTGENALLMKQQLEERSGGDTNVYPLHHYGFLTLGLIGEPNMGKSSLLNNLLGYKRVKVSSTPGCTKKFQTHFYNKTLLLCDCPGVVFPRLKVSKALQTISGTYPVSQVREPYSAIRYLAERCAPRLHLYYNLAPRNLNRTLSLGRLRMRSSIILLIKLENPMNFG